ncbi:hypothetical protein OE88DRAFT_1736184 [Heliocybe sulcata]|uniref:F-box domain-containing protein n=1 Tax=Heliocybe sulcata TaxID=5364 RepID=A0A5C3MYY6_9AGAM|nr:hypothetical protein OE88DRAFT_1736184 [Heliocybe sulcata]
MTPKTFYMRFPAKPWTPGEDRWPEAQSDPVKATAVEERQLARSNSTGTALSLKAPTGTNNGKKRYRKASHFPFSQLPEELMVEVLKHMDPVEALAFRQVSKRFKRIITEGVLRSVRIAWCAPEPPQGMKEVCWVNVLFGRTCQLCGQSGAACSPVTSTVLGRRVCLPCRSRSARRVDNEAPGDVLLIKPDTTVNTKDLITWGDWTMFDDFSEPWSFALWFCWAKEHDTVYDNLGRLLDIVEKDRKMGQLKLENYIECRKQLVTDRMKKVEEVRRWMKTNTTARRSARRSATQQITS